MEEEKSPLTVEKYLRDVNAFFTWKNNKEVTRKDAVLYKKQLEERYAPSSVNSMLVALNGFFEFCGMPQLKIKPLKIQKSLFAEADKELSQAEYKRLITADRNIKNERLSLVMQVICSTGIRVSEQRFVTVEAVEAGRAEVSSKGKHRIVFLRPEMKQSLMRYAKKQGIISDCILNLKDIPSDATVIVIIKTPSNIEIEEYSGSDRLMFLQQADGQLPELYTEVDSRTG